MMKKYISKIITHIHYVYCFFRFYTYAVTNFQ